LNDENLGIKEHILVSVTDGFWFAGYVFLALHLSTILRSIRSTIKLRVVIITSILTVLFVSYNILTLISSVEEEEFTASEVDSVTFLVTIAYPILDLILIVPSAIILASLRKEYEQSIPWFLSS
jgi:hypothetical protein